MLHQIDLNEDHKDNFDKLQDLHLPSSGVDLMVCNFAFHYFIPDRKHLMNIIKFINHYLKPGGRFVFTAFDGRAIIRLLNENNGNWTVSKGKEIKYSIKKQYKINVLEPIGQKIDVLLPFSNNDYYSEYLVNIEYIASEFSSYGITLETDQSFEEYLIEYKNTNYKGYNTMDADDRKYSSLYHYYCFYKQKTTEKVAGTHKKRQIKRN
jgi:SAM-dependent methyltransferase